MFRCGPRGRQTFVRALARSFRWRKMLDEGAHAMLEDLARASVNATYVSRVLRLTLLAPEIVETILDGRQRAELQLDELLAAFPLDWAFQLIGKRRHLAFGWRAKLTQFEGRPRDRQAPLILS